jgi:hypothetical protein
MDRVMQLIKSNPELQISFKDVRYNDNTGWNATLVISGKDYCNYSFYSSIREFQTQFFGGVAR